MSELWAKALSFIVPNIVTILSVLGFFINSRIKSKKDVKGLITELQEKTNKIQKMEQDVAICKSKLETLEQYLMKKEQK